MDPKALSVGGQKNRDGARWNKSIRFVEREKIKSNKGRLTRLGHIREGQKRISRQILSNRKGDLKADAHLIGGLYSAEVPGPGGHSTYERNICATIERRQEGYFIDGRRQKQGLKLRCVVLTGRCADKGREGLARSHCYRPGGNPESWRLGLRGGKSVYSRRGGGRRNPPYVTGKIRTGRSGV